MTATLDAEAAARCLRDGGVIAYPTEAVWGLGCDPFDMIALERLLTIKQRSADKGLIVIAADIEQLRPLLDMDALPATRLAEVEASWPGPNTWLMPCRDDLPFSLRGDNPRLAVRVSAHAPVIALCRAFGGPVVSTSANLSGEEPARRRKDLSAALLSQLDAVMDGETGERPRPSTIRDALDGRVLRS
ncbi:MAG: Sua5/YciO/YrdC/YwlC family protein [Xanthomonadales bacterium]|nr:Sua5/YciO/YrdC/YwlC family protein [Xanthomonadales bacterium]